MSVNILLAGRAEKMQRMEERRQQTAERVKERAELELERQAERDRRVKEQERRETPEYKIRVFSAQIESQQTTYDALLNGGHSRYVQFVVREKEKLDQLIESFRSFVYCLKKDKIVGMTEKEKDLMFQKFKEEVQDERKRERERRELEVVSEKTKRKQESQPEREERERREQREERVKNEVIQEERRQRQLKISQEKIEAEKEREEKYQFKYHVKFTEGELIFIEKKDNQIEQLEKQLQQIKQRKQEVWTKSAKNNCLMTCQMYMEVGMCERTEGSYTQQIQQNQQERDTYIKEIARRKEADREKKLREEKVIQQRAWFKQRQEQAYQELQEKREQNRQQELLKQFAGNKELLDMIMTQVKNEITQGFADMSSQMEASTDFIASRIPA